MEKKWESVAFFSDAEGVEGKFLDFCSRSPGFFMGSDGHYHLKPGVRFVYGGDVGDRGSESEFILTTLFRLKAESRRDVFGPLFERESVYWLSGNRDDNKPRFALELSPEKLREPLTSAAWTNWIRDDVMAQGLADAPRSFQAGAVEFDNRVNRARFFLAKLMGAPKLFDLRKKQCLIHNPNVSNETVVENIVSDVAEGGKLRRYLEEATPIVVFTFPNGRKAIFTHADITADNFLKVPTTVPDEFELAATVHEWANRLYVWHRQQIESFELAFDSVNPAFRETAMKLRPAESLFRYCDKTPGQKMNAFSTNYARNVDELNNYVLPGRPLLEHPEAQQADFFSGHTPSGPSALLARSGTQRFFRSDNSYLSNEKFAISVFIVGDDHGTVVVDAQLAEADANGQPLRIHFKNLVQDTGPVGLQTTDGFTVLGKLAEDSRLPGDCEKIYLGFRFVEWQKEAIHFYSDSELKKLGVRNFPLSVD